MLLGVGMIVLPVEADAGPVRRFREAFRLR
jgi:hypothetical protein